MCVMRRGARTIGIGRPTTLVAGHCSGTVVFRGTGFEASGEGYARGKGFVADMDARGGYGVGFWRSEEEGAGVVGGMEGRTGRDGFVERVGFLAGEVEVFPGVGRGAALGDLFEQTREDSWHQRVTAMATIIANAKAVWRKPTKPDAAVHPVTLAVIGCGQRGKVGPSTVAPSPYPSLITKAYARYVSECPDLCKIVAIAEPRPQTRQILAKNHNVDKTLVFTTWQDLHAASAETINTIGKRLADAVVIAVQDSLHLQVATAFAEQGYHILCEKPMATTPEDCIKMETAIKKAGTIFGMGHGKYLSVHANWVDHSSL